MLVVHEPIFVALEASRPNDSNDIDNSDDDAAVSSFVLFVNSFARFALSSEYH